MSAQYLTTEELNDAYAKYFEEHYPRIRFGQYITIVYGFDIGGDIWEEKSPGVVYRALLERLKDYQT